MSTTRQRITAHARWEFRLLIRNGEQILLMFVIPIALLLALHLVNRAGVEQLVPMVLAVSVMATCFTSLAIGTGFERRSGALRYSATTPLTRLDLLIGKFAATAVLTLLSIIAVAFTGVAIGWRPPATWPIAILVVVLGAAAFAAWAVLLAGTLRAEAVLAVANGLFIVLMIFGGVLIPAASMPGVLSNIVALLPSAALADGLTTSLGTGGYPFGPMALLLVWAVLGALLARRRFTWD